MIKKGLAVAVILLFIGMCVVPSTAVQELREKPLPINFDGNILYVGGSGPNNYTTIQSAINDASDGDTVFVYDDSSPYSEYINISQQITVIGENRDSTILQRTNDEDENFIISSSHVTISDFSFIGTAISIGSQYEFIHIYNMNFTSRFPHPSITLSGSNCTIDNCIFNGIINERHSEKSIYIDGNYNIIHHNTFCRSGDSVVIYSAENSIHNNTFYLLYHAIELRNFYDVSNYVKDNNFIYCVMGIVLASKENIVTQNNFIRNTFDGFFRDALYIYQSSFYNNYYSSWKGFGNKALVGEIIIFIWYSSFGFVYFRFDKVPSRTIFDNPLSPEMEYNSIIDMKNDINLFMEFYNGFWDDLMGNGMLLLYWFLTQLLD